MNTHTNNHIDRIKAHKSFVVGEEAKSRSYYLSRIVFISFKLYADLLFPYCWLRTDKGNLTRPGPGHRSNIVVRVSCCEILGEMSGSLVRSRLANT